MKTITVGENGKKPLGKRPPKLPKAKKVEQFPPVNFSVFHGRVIECFEGKIPIVHGGGMTVRGYGGSWVGTTVRDVLSAWFVDHQTGQQHKIDFGDDYLDMRYGHDVTMLWANGQLYAIANHTTGRIKYPALHRPLLPEKKLYSAFGSLVLFLILALVGGVTSFVCVAAFLTMVHGPWSQIRHHHWEVTDIGASIGLLIATFATLIIAGLPVVLRARSDAKDRAYNKKQDSYLTEKLSQAEDQWIRQYSPPRESLRF